MKRERVGDLIDQMQAMVKKAGGCARKAMAGQLAYFTTAQQQQRLNYSQVAAMKLPIGSGAI